MGINRSDSSGPPVDNAAFSAEHCDALVAALEALCAGDLSVRLPTDWPEHASRIASAFNRLSTRLASVGPDRDELAERARLLEELDHANECLAGETLRRRRAEISLEESAQKRSEFLSLLGHELRNPLAALQSGVELLRLTPLPVRKVPWARDLLQRQVRHLRRLVDDLLDVSRLTTGRLQLRRETVALRDVVDQALDTAQPLILEKGHALDIRLPAEPVWLHVDPVRLTQVLGNLLTNAAKFTDAGGRISILAGVENGQFPGVILRVTDTGRGIPEDKLEQVFGMFEQVDARARGCGLGVGLTLARTLAELHGGSLHAKSGGTACGTELVLRLPLPDRNGLCAPKPGAGERSAPAPMRVLIIDDNTDFAEGLAAYLRGKWRLQVEVASDGLAGVAAAGRCQPDAILLDIGLPDIDGYEVARRLRRLSGCERLPLIAITGFGSEDHRARARQAGISAYLVKPVSCEAVCDLLAAVRANT